MGDLTRPELTASQEPISQGPVMIENFFCGNFTHGPVEYAAIGLSSFLYLFLLVVAVVVAIHGCRRVHNRRWGMQQSHHSVERSQNLRLAITIFITLFLTARIMANIFSVTLADPLYALWWATNRIASICGLIAFTLVGSLWLSIGHHARDPPKMKQRRFDRLNTIGTVLISLALVIYLIVIIAIEPGARPDSYSFEINVIISSALQLGMMVFFTAYGSVLYCLIRHAGRSMGSHNTHVQRPQQTGSIARVAALYSVFFLMRGIIFSYWLFTDGCWLRLWFFWSLGYYIPEIVTVGHVLWSYYKINKRDARERREYRRLAKRGTAKPSPQIANRTLLPHLLERRRGSLGEEIIEADNNELLDDDDDFLDGGGGAFDINAITSDSASQYSSIDTGSEFDSSEASGEEHETVTAFG